MYLKGREVFGLAFSAVGASSVAVVRQAITGKSLGRKQDPYVIIQWMAQLSRT